LPLEPHPTTPFPLNVSPDEARTVEAPVTERNQATAEIAPRTTPRHKGLSAAEVIARRERGEGNIAPHESSRSYKRILRENAVSFINVLLFAIAVMLVALGLYSDAVITAGLVVFNVVVGIFQEARAKWKLDGIALLNRPTATVLRDSREQEVNPSELVRGDLVILHPGDQIVVDGVLVETGRLDVDESLLTGESDRVGKKPGDTVLSGSFCINGSGIYEATRVGEKSLAQQITAGARAFRQVRTPLQKDVRLVIQASAVAIVVLSILVANNFRHLYHTLPLVESVRAAAVIVAVVPQGLYVMVAVTYALAAMRMTGKGVLIQRTNAIESMSHLDILCMDKTGTLTTNKLEVAEFSPAVGISEIRLREILGAYAASTPATNHTIDALHSACGGEARAVIAEIPFASERKWSALTFDADMSGCYILGAPEMLVPHLRPGSNIEARINDWTHRGLRVLLFTSASANGPLATESVNPTLPEWLDLVGAISFRDELRQEAQSTIQGFSQLGIRMKIISGDSPDTVVALARQAGISHSERAVSGLQLDGLNDLEFQQIAEDATVFGRVTPQQKERLIRTLGERGHYVAMIGDGVNDVLALKQSKLAIAMRGGSQVTRSVADLVLLNDSYAVLPPLFQEGQRILTGMQDIVRLFLVRMLTVAFVVFGTSLLGEQFPILPQHNGILALLTVGIPTLALALWAKPGTPVKNLLRSAAPFVIPASITIAAASVAIYALFESLTSDVALARTALTTTMVFCCLLLIPFLEPPTEAWVAAHDLNGDWRPTILAAAMFVLYGVFMAVPLFRHFYQLELLRPADLIVIGLVVVGWASMQRYIWRLKPFERADEVWSKMKFRFKRQRA
jgi:cation-transporting ATPase E